MTNRISFEAARKMGLGHLLKPTDIPEEKKRKSKYGNTVVETDDMKFDSKKEERHYRKLKVMERAGLIADLKHHVVFELAPAVKYSTATRKSLLYAMKLILLTWRMGCLWLKM